MIMIFFLIFVCYVAYTAKYLSCLLKSTEVIQIWEFDNLHMTQCAKIIVGFMANVSNVFYPTFTNVSFIFSTFLTFLTFFIFISTFITSMDRADSAKKLCLAAAETKHVHALFSSVERSALTGWSLVSSTTHFLITAPHIFGINMSFFHGLSNSIWAYLSSDLVRSERVYC